MNNDRELLQQALDALEGLLGWQSLAPTKEQDDAKAAAFRLRARLAQPEPETCRRCRGRRWYTCGASDMRLKCPECGGKND